MSRLNTLTTLVSAGYPAWYAFGVSRGIIDTSQGLRTDLVTPVSGLVDRDILLDNDIDPILTYLPELDKSKNKLNNEKDIDYNPNKNKLDGSTLTKIRVRRNKLIRILTTGKTEFNVDKLTKLKKAYKDARRIDKTNNLFEDL